MRLKYRLRTLFIIAALAAIVLAYGATYFSLLDPIHVVSESAGGVANGHREVGFRFGGRTSEIVFAPVSIVDQLVRPQYWRSWSSVDDAVESRKFPWGHVDYINGRICAFSIYANSRRDVVDAITELRDLRTPVCLRIRGEEFCDSDLELLKEFRTLHSIELLATRVTRQAVRNFRRSNPELEISCVAVTSDGTEIY